MTEPVLTVSGLRAYSRTSAFGVDREVRAVDDISLSIATNEIYGLAGESSSGKTTLIKTIADAIRPPLKVLAGSVGFNFHDRRATSTVLRRGNCRRSAGSIFPTSCRAR